MGRVSSASPSPPALTRAGFHTLLALAAGHAHGYAIMGFVEELTEGSARMGPGTLYRTIARLVSDGLVVEAEGESDPDAPHDARRRYYSLTERGRAAAAAEAAVLERVVEAAGQAGLLPRHRTGRRAS